MTNNQFLAIRDCLTVLRELERGGEFSDSDLKSLAKLARIKLEDLFDYIRSATLKLGVGSSTIETELDRQI